METLKYIYLEQHRNGMYEILIQLDDIGFTLGIEPGCPATRIASHLREAAEYLDKIEASKNKPE